jgi:hypothetical protein
VFKKQEEPHPPAEVAEERKKGDAIDTFIEKLYTHMKSSKLFPNSLRELAKLIKQNITKKGADQKEVSNVEDVLKRMHGNGMFTKKMRTGESKEHAKEQVKIKFQDIIELFKREEKEDIGIVFESQFKFNTTQPAGGASSSNPK